MNILECKGLTKRFGAMTALDGVSFGIEPGPHCGPAGSQRQREDHPH